ncbi:CU044_2847 family protein [Streptomyces sp. P10-4]|uniref:CU044_2847 family protein n=1 Tax=Streptomyces sp. P10-4 TaxID=3421645 RepID=UPI003D29812C
MADTTEFRVSDGSVLRVEVDGPAPPGGAAYEPVRRRRGDAAGAAADTLRQAVDRVRPAVQDVLASLRAMPQAPDRVCLEFGVKLSADAGVVLARAATEAHFKVALEWERRPGGTGRDGADDEPDPDAEPGGSGRNDADGRTAPDREPGGTGRNRADDEPAPDAEPAVDGD